jgi:transposase InsO family protein
MAMNRGFLYLLAIIDWASRRVLAHRVSISMTPDFCVEALEEAIAKYGPPEIFNIDQGSQFTCNDFTNVLKALAGQTLDTAYYRKHSIQTGSVKLIRVTHPAARSAFVASDACARQRG